MKTPIIGVAQQFTEDELKIVLNTPEVKDFGNHGFTGAQCLVCLTQANFPVSFLWTDRWTCTCGSINVISPNTIWASPWDRPEIGPPKALLNRILDELGLHGRKY